MFDVITIGGVTRDTFFMTDQARVIEDKSGKNLKKYLAFAYGSKIIPEQAEFTYGGGGANSAMSFAKLGLNCAAILRVGMEGTGNLAVKDLEAAGVNCHYISKDNVNHTALSIIVSVPGDDHTMFLYRGANDYLEVHDWRQVKTKWLYVSSLTGHSADLIPEIFSFARAHNIKVAWNPGSEQLREGFSDISSYLELTSVLILNRDEASALALSKDNRTRVMDEKILLKSLNEMTGGIVVVTDSKNGSYVTDGEIDYFEPTSQNNNVIETTGAGDAYGSTFVAALIKGFRIQKAMELANTNAENVISYVGAQKGLMTFEELRGKIELGEEDEISFKK